MAYGMSVRQLLLVIWSGRLRLVLCTLACLGAAMTFSLRAQKAYEAKARVLLEVTSADPVSGYVYGSKMVDSYIDTQRLLAMSTRVAERAVDKLGWAQNPAVIDTWQAETGGSGDIRQWAGARLAAGVAAYPLEGGGTMEIAYRAADPEGAAAIVRTVREAYIETALALQTESAARRAASYSGLAKAARAKLAAAEDRLIALQRKTGTVIGARGVDIDSAAIVHEDRNSFDTALNANTRALQAQTPGISVDEIIVRRKIAALEQQIGAAESIAGTDNPDYRALLDRRAALMGEMARARASDAARRGIVASAARQMAAETQTNYANERARVLGRGDADIRLGEASRIVTLRSNELNRILQLQALAQQAAERTESGLVVLGDVIADPDPVAPNMWLNGGLATLFGLLLGLASVLIDGLAWREVLGCDDLAEASGVPVLATIPPARGRRGRAWLRRLWPRRVAAA